MLLNKNDNINYKKVNEVLSLSTKILRILYILIFIIGIYAITLIFKAWNIFPIIGNFLTLLSPLFIGIVFAWLLDPVADFLRRKGIKRSWGTLIILMALILVIAIVLAAFIPLMKDQIDQFISIIPNLIDTTTSWVNNFLSGLDSKNATTIQDNFTKTIENIGSDLTANLPNATINFVSSFFSGLGTFLIGLIIGFYLLLNFDKVHKSIIEFLPVRYKDVYSNIAKEMNTSLRNFVSGTLFTSFLVFIACMIGFFAVGLSSPVLFALICGITNLIPYIGPYIGGVPAIIVGFTISPMCGILTLVVVVIVQLIESFLIHPMVMSKAVELHPVTIIVGLIVFGSFFGILGMILATPIIAILKITFKFLVEKYNFFNWKEEIKQ